MIKLGVISDTHMNHPSRELATLVEPGGPFHGLDRILHAGDITSLSVLDAFAPVPVEAVAGNMDSHQASMNLPEQRIIQAGAFSIGLMHGWGSKVNLEEKIMTRFTGMDVIVYGHSHVPANERRGKILLFNPGSFLSGTVGVLRVGETREEGVTGEIIHLNKI